MKKKKKQNKSGAFRQEDQKKMLNSNSAFAVKEAYNAIRTNIMFTQQGEKCPVFIITSPGANNGKSLNSINLAISFAQMDKRTLLIDADMRNPTVHRMFGISGKNGLSEILAGLTDSITVSKTDVENLSILTAGKIPPNPTELLSSERMDKLLKFVKEHYDYIFIDTPPVNVVMDAAALVNNSTGYLMVVKSGSDIQEVKLAVSSLTKIEGNIVGFVMNDVVDFGKSYKSYYSKKYKYYYRSNYRYKYRYDYKSNYNYTYGSSQ